MAETDTVSVADTTMITKAKTWTETREKTRTEMDAERETETETERPRSRILRGKAWSRNGFTNYTAMRTRPRPPAVATGYERD